MEGGQSPIGSFRDRIMAWAKRGVWTFDFPPLASFSSTSACRLRRSRGGATANRPARYTKYALGVGEIGMVQHNTVPGTSSTMPRGFDKAPQYGRATVWLWIPKMGSRDWRARAWLMHLPKPKPGSLRRGRLQCKRTAGLRQKYLVLRRRDPGARHQLFCCCLWWTNCVDVGCQHLHTQDLGTQHSSWYLMIWNWGICPPRRPG